MRRLLVDAMLGGLVSYLRLCGYDTVYTLEADLDSDAAIADEARRTDRFLLTRDRALASRLDRALVVDADEAREQLRALAAAGFALELPDTPSRCSTCNGTLEGVTADTTTPAAVPAAGECEVWQCSACGQYFWRGSHWDHVAETLASVRSDGSTAPDRFE